MIERQFGTENLTVTFTYKMVLSRRLLQTAFLVLLILLAGAYYTNIKSLPLSNLLRSAHISSWRGDAHSIIYKGQHEIDLTRFCMYFREEDTCMLYW